MDDVQDLRFSPPAKLRIDNDALISNWHALKKAGGGAQTGAAVKADAYGIGAPNAVRALAGAGCQDFFVAHWQEAAKIAGIVPPHHISVFNGVSAQDIHAAIALGAIPVLNTPQQIADWKAAGGGPCHVMLDTGINRLGLGSEQATSEILGGLNIDILMSHLASADQDVPQNHRQCTLFKELSSNIAARRRSLANSAGIMLGREYHFDLTRPGLALYGGIPRPELADTIKQVAYPQAQILQVRTLKAGEPVGYNATYICPKDMRIATAAIGYADGYSRAFSNQGCVRYGETVLPVIGRVSMDVITIDASQSADLGEGDWIDIAYDLPEASRISGLSQYELLTRLGRR
jgi:alanine racemase